MRTPTSQLLSAIAGLVGGAALIGMWCVGLTLMVGAVAWGADAFLRDDGKKPEPVVSGHDMVLERYRKAS